MKLNDPFGRMEKRHQVGYESMRDSLRRGGIDSPQAAHELIKQSKKRALNLLGGVAVLCLGVILVLPKATPVALGLSLFLAVWVANSTVNGKRYIQRYIDEEIQAKGENKLV